MSTVFTHKADKKLIQNYMEIYITTTFDAQINIAGIQTILLQNETARLTPSGSKKTLISVVPINEVGDSYLLPYCLSLNLDNDAICESEFCDVKLVDNVCNIRLLAKQLSRTQLFTTITYSGKKYTLMQNAFDHTVSIKCENISHELSLEFTVRNFNYYTKNFGGANYIFLEFAGINNAYLMFGKEIVNPIFAGVVNSYEWNDNTITLAQKFDGELCQIKLSKYIFDADCKLLNEEIGYLKDKPPLRPVPALVPYLFLECVLAGNLSYAKELLTQDFGEIINQDVLKDYFPPFDSFCQYRCGDCKTDRLALIKKGRLIGVLDFEIVNGKIANIISF